jgi:hypothetical protein
MSGKKQLGKFTEAELKKRTKARVYVPDDCQLTSIYGVAFSLDETGRKFADIPGVQEFITTTRDLFPHWEVSEPFVNMED